MYLFSYSNYYKYLFLCIRWSITSSCKYRDLAEIIGQVRKSSEKIVSNESSLVHFLLPPESDRKLDFSPRSLLENESRNIFGS